MTPLLCYFKSPPQGIVESRSVWLRTRVELALSMGIEPAVLPSVGLERQAIAMPADLLAKVRSLAEERGVAPGRMVGMLASAVDDVQRPSAQILPPVNDSGDRPEQIRLLAAALPLLDAGRVVLMEAGTGVGKSRLAARIAQHFAGGGGSRTVMPDGGARTAVLVATQSVSQLCHLTREIQALRQHPSGSDIPRPSVVLGRSNFIDVDLALEFAEAAGNVTAREWLVSGAPAGLTDGTRTIAEIIPGACGLMDDWLHVLGDEPAAEDGLECSVDDVVLTEDSSPESQACYNDLRAIALDHPLVLCTHAMLGSDAIARRTGRAALLPDAVCLIVDEAHQLEQEVAKVASHAVSLWSLSLLLRREKWQSLKAGKEAQTALKLVTRCIASMSSLPIGAAQSVRITADLSDAPEGFRNGWEACKTDLVATHESLRALCDKVAKSNLPGWRNASQQLERASRAIKMSVAGGFEVELSLSAVRKLASLTVGPRGVGYLLRPLWERSHSAALLSATLYVPTYSGETSFFISRTLALPPDRTSQTPSEHPQWVTMTPTLMLPQGKELLAALTPPTKDAAADTDCLAAWLAKVAEVVLAVAQSAAGGTLVLMSSHERLQILAGLLEDLRGAGRLIVQTQSKGVSRCEHEFRKLAAKGMRPIWLSTGGAWTGLDLRDRDAAEGADDLLLTDLVIPNVPLGMNKSTTHAARKDRFLPFEGMSMALLLRQGLGRLVRRPGLQHRRIWMLDGRLLVRKAASSGSLYAPCLLMLDRFRRSSRFTLPLE